MKSTKTFKQTIQTQLKKMAENDQLFAKSLAKENKNIDDCITYILNTVQKSGCNGFTDDEIYGMAAHYYDEDDLQAGNPIQAKVVVNHKAELTAEEIAEAKRQAMQQVLEEQKQKVITKPKVKPAEQHKAENLSLF